MDQLAATFLRRILGVPLSIKLPTLILELGIHLPSTMAWILTFKFWLRLFLNTASDSLLSELLKDSYHFSWFLLCETKLSEIDLSFDFFL